MKINFGGKWEMDIGPSHLSAELEAAIKDTVRLTKELDQMVESEMVEINKLSQREIREDNK